MTTVAITAVDVVDVTVLYDNGEHSVNHEIQDWLHLHLQHAEESFGRHMVDDILPKTAGIMSADMR